MISRWVWITIVVEEGGRTVTIPTAARQAGTFSPVDAELGLARWLSRSRNRSYGQDLASRHFLIVIVRYRIYVESTGSLLVTRQLLKFTSVR